MRDNIGKVMERGEKIDDLVGKTEQLEITVTISRSKLREYIYIYIYY
jgi:hypothetical protein